MQQNVIKIVLLILSYLIGSIPFGFVIGRLKGIDIREHGSSNIGSTNVARTLGFKYGLIVLFLDCLKGALIVSLFTLKIIPAQYSLPTPLIYGLAATLGHSFSIFLKFKGGKAVATSAGVLLAYSPLVALIAFLSFYLVVKITKYVSLGSLIGASIAFISSVVFTLIGLYDRYEAYGFKYFHKAYFPIVTVILMLIIFLRHRKNIENLKNQTENKFEIK